MPKKAKRMKQPKNLEDFLAMPNQLQDRWNRMTQAISQMREQQVSLVRASRDFQLSPGVVRSMAGAALRKQKNGRYVARETDRLLRVLLLPEKSGLREVGVSDSREATLVGKYWNAVNHYLDTGDSSLIRKIRRTAIVDANGKRISLLKDLQLLDLLASAGVFTFESIYARAA